MPLGRNSAAPYDQGKTCTCNNTTTGGSCIQTGTLAESLSEDTFQELTSSLFDYFNEDYSTRLSKASVLP
jgi:hypothetical protein